MLRGRLHRGRRRRRATARQITLAPAAGFVNNTIDPSRFNPVALNFLKHVPVSTDPCGRLQYGIPNNNTEHQTLGTRRLHAEPQRRRLFGRYLYAVYDNPATYDGTNALTLSRTGQNNQVHSLVVGHNWVLSAVDGERASTSPATGRSTIGRCRSTSRRPISAPRSTARSRATWA